MFRKLVCPIDFSPGSEQGLKFAAAMAKDLEAELVIAHVWYVAPLAYVGEGFPHQSWENLREESERMLATAKQQATTYGASRVSTVFLTGVPWAQIAELTKDPAVDLVVIGTTGRTGLSRFLMGSVAEQVVRHAECSVLVARGEYASFHHVACAVDFSEPSRAAMHAAAGLARETVTLFHAIDFPALYGVVPGRTDAALELDRRAKASLRRWEDDLHGMTRASVTAQASFGSPAAEALELLDRNPKLDLVVVGSRGHTGIRRVLLGSVAERIVRHARTPVLVARMRS